MFSDLTWVIKNEVCIYCILFLPLSECLKFKFTESLSRLVKYYWYSKKPSELREVRKNLFGGLRPLIGECITRLSSMPGEL